MRAASILFMSLAVIAALSASPQAWAQARRAAPSETPTQILAAANNAARQQPTRDGFSQARQVFTYQPGAIYEIHASPSYVSTILLEPGESLRDIAAGDTSRWMVTRVEGDAEDAPAIVLVKPNAPGLRTNIVLITDRRTYLVEAISSAGSTYTAQIAWSYPSEEAARAPSIDTLNFNYRVRAVRGPRPAWLPTRVFDDGARTWVEFPVAASSSELPPIFVVSGEGVELVNYRVHEGASGPRYQIDRVFDVAELRLGARAPTIVRIERDSPSRTPRARRRP